MKDIIKLFRAARRVSTPAIAFETSDQRALEARVMAAANGDAPKLRMDILTGLTGITGNDAGLALAQEINGKSPEKFRNPVEVLSAGFRFPKRTVLSIFNAHQFIKDARFVQGIFNLRDHWKTDFRTLCLYAPSFPEIPRELNVMVFEEELPDEGEIGQILDGLYGATLGVDPPNEIFQDAVNAARGIPAFDAEQIFAMSLLKEGLDGDAVWERKAAMVNKTRALGFTREGPTFDDIGGLEAFKVYMHLVAGGPKRFGCTLFMDEIEKSMSGANAMGGDSSGVSQGIEEQLLGWMQNKGHTGILAVGMPGTGKSYAGMAIGPTFGVPTVTLDIGGLKHGIVGSTEENVRAALKMVDSIAGDGGVFCFATCNKEANLKPEFKRRFVDGRWFFDLPDDEEKIKIWEIQMEAYDLQPVHCKGGIPDDTGWTGAEIRNACELAWKLNVSLVEAAKYVIPVATSDPDTVVGLRTSARGKWLSASYPGKYRGPNEEQKIVEDLHRAIETEERVGVPADEIFNIGK